MPGKQREQKNLNSVTSSGLLPFILMKIAFCGKMREIFNFAKVDIAEWSVGRLELCWI
ncbi:MULTISPECIES: hypothetical protein [Paenibacillus]|uniref:hypothetical protein n=1 Tax=Paenibacillus TaxID=44249 RepID=UPI00203D726E|nr:MULTISPECIES: hypothetical protein [Paenibacillus]